MNKEKDNEGRVSTEKRKQKTKEDFGRTNENNEETHQDRPPWPFQSHKLFGWGTPCSCRPYRPARCRRPRSLKRTRGENKQKGGAQPRGRELKRRKQHKHRANDREIKMRRTSVGVFGHGGRCRHFSTDNSTKTKSEDAKLRIVKSRVFFSPLGF